ncbi:acyltransferase [Paucibacter sp. R3-3]|uniref:Acyltransferase n=1 Tax=Roseateles agri TaxID=3098619 RepID=A0ABU5DAG1_9BURK|nr:acyltransferase [Paucibacter sp. R3-3]MDY0743272.1 acyltransferase [Paucibacter sp. R3-3]
MLKSLQAGRAIAALMVVLYHMGPAVEKYFGLGALAAPWGRAGVEFFFVLSGFIIASAHWDDIGRLDRLGRFAWKRFVRIYPIYWVVFLLAFTGAYRLLNLSVAEVLHGLLLTPTGVAPVISVAWSLQWEIVFYVLFASLIVHPALALAVLAAVLIGLPGSPKYLMLFLAGVACAVVDRRQLAVPGRLVALIGTLVFAAASAVETVSGGQPVFWYGVGAALLVLGLVRAERAGHMIGAHPALQLLGNASYSIYLLHYPFISAACKVAAAVGLRGPAWGAAVYAVVLMAAVAAGVLLHLYVERPLIDRLTARRPVLAPVAD